MDLITIRQAVRDDYTLDAPSATVLDRRIAAAVREYSRYNPRAVYTTFETEANENTYILDVDNPVNGIWFVLYFPTGEAYNILLASNEIVHLLREPSHYLLTSQRVIEDIKEAARIRAMTGDWEWRPGTKEVVLSPTPTASGLTVHVTYWAPHVLEAEEGTGYETIPDEDQDIIVDLTLAELLTRHQVEAAAMPDQAEGLERVTYHYTVANIDLAIMRLRSGLIAKYGGTAIMVGP